MGSEMCIRDSLEMDDNDDKAIDLQEWREAYIMSRAPANAEQERYQD